MSWHRPDSMALLTARTYEETLRSFGLRVEVIAQDQPVTMKVQVEVIIKENGREFLKVDFSSTPSIRDVDVLWNTINAWLLKQITDLSTWK